MCITRRDYRVEIGEYEMVREETGFWGSVKRAQNVGGAAAALILLIAGTLCVDYLWHKSAGDVPILSNALTVALGFYFGAKNRAQDVRDAQRTPPAQQTP
jgi:hypothetical protein